MNEPEPEEEDRGAIEAKGPASSLRIPASRKDIGPYLKWIIIMIAYAIGIIATGVAWSLAK